MLHSVGDYWSNTVIAFTHATLAQIAKRQSEIFLNDDSAGFEGYTQEFMRYIMLDSLAETYLNMEDESP